MFLFLCRFFKILGKKFWTFLGNEILFAPNIHHIRVQKCCLLYPMQQFSANVVIAKNFRKHRLNLLQKLFAAIILKLLHHTHCYRSFFYSVCVYVRMGDGCTYIDRSINTHTHKHSYIHTHTYIRTYI